MVKYIVVAANFAFWGLWTIAAYRSIPVSLIKTEWVLEKLNAKFASKISPYIKCLAVVTIIVSWFFCSFWAGRSILKVVNAESNSFPITYKLVLNSLNPFTKFEKLVPGKLEFSIEWQAIEGQKLYFLPVTYNH
jgi:hypothetical protein